MTLYGATCPNRTDDLLIHTTTIFIAIIFYVCGLDFLFAIVVTLGTSYKVSTLGNYFPSSGLTYTSYLVFPELAMSTLQVSL